MFNTLNLRAAVIAAVATVLLVASILIGSRNLGNFDAALIAYLFGCIFACFRGGLSLHRLAATSADVALLRARLAVVLHRENDGLRLGVREALRGSVPRAEIHPQRGKARGYGHMLMAWGLSARLCGYVSARFWLDSFRAQAGRH
jgi:hypothetical protein